MLSLVQLRDFTHAATNHGVLEHEMSFSYEKLSNEKENSTLEREIKLINRKMEGELKL
jgi:hypothetical protein